MADKKTAVYDIKNLINNYFGQDEEITDESVIDGAFMNIIEAVLKPSKHGKQLFSALTSRENAEDRKSPDSNIYRRIYTHLNEQMMSNKFAFERNNPTQLASVMFMIKVDRTGKIREALSSKSSLSFESTRNLIKVANSLDEKGLYKLADKIDNFFLTTANDAGPVPGAIRTEGKFTTIHRDDGKIIVSSKVVYDHIGTHGSLGKGSVFSGSVTPEMINEFLSTADIPAGGGGIPAELGAGAGYLLVAPFEVAMQFDDATVKPGAKEDFDPAKGEMISVPITEVHTSKPIDDFKTDVTTVLVFPYDPGRSDLDQNDFVNNNEELARALSDGSLYALATAFPGGFSLKEVGGISFPEQQVPRATAWGGLDDPKWAVIIPDQGTLGAEESEEELLETI